MTGGDAIGAVSIRHKPLAPCALSSPERPARITAPPGMPDQRPGCTCPRAGRPRVKRSSAPFPPPGTRFVKENVAYAIPPECRLLPKPPPPQRDYRACYWSTYRTTAGRGCPGLAGGGDAAGAVCGHGRAPATAAGGQRLSILLSYEATLDGARMWREGFCLQSALQAALHLQRRAGAHGVTSPCILHAAWA
jgi:hypothetical protein